MKTFRVTRGSLSRSFKQAITSGGRVIMAIADEPKLLNSLYTIKNNRRSEIGRVQPQCLVLT